MSPVFDQVFQHLNVTDLERIGDDFENCEFQNCDFNQADLTGFKFTDCTFISSNLSLIKVRGTAFRSVLFKECKILGVHFDEVNSLGLEFGFESCVLNHSSFYQLSLKKISLQKSELQGCDFSDCDLSLANFGGSQLLEAKFDGTNLQGANLIGASGFQISPVRNRVKNMRLSREELIGMLSEFGLKIE